MRYKIAEKINEKSALILKGLTFNKYENAISIAVKLALRHRDKIYCVCDTETHSTYQVTLEDVTGTEIQTK